MSRKNKRDAYLSRPKTPARPAAELAADRNSESESDQSGAHATGRGISSSAGSASGGSAGGNGPGSADLAKRDHSRSGTRSGGRGSQGLDLLQVYAAAAAFFTLVMLMFGVREISEISVMMLSPLPIQCLDESTDRTQSSMVADDDMTQNLDDGDAPDNGGDGGAAAGTALSIADPFQGECRYAMLQRDQAPAKLVSTAINTVVALLVFVGHLILLLRCRGVRFHA